MPDAHEAVRQATLATEAEGISLKEALSRDPGVWRRISEALQRTTGADAEEFFSAPERYSGRAAETARAVFDHFESALGGSDAEQA